MAVWTRTSASCVLVAAAIVILFPVCCDAWWWGARPRDKEEKLDTLSQALRAAEDAANYSQTALAEVEMAEQQARAAEKEAEKAETKINGAFATLFGVSEGDRQMAADSREEASRRRSQVAVATKNAEKAMVIANQTRRRAEIAKNASSIADERHAAEQQLNLTKVTAEKKQSGLKQTSSQLKALKLSAKRARNEVAEASMQAKAAKTEADEAKQVIEKLRQEASKSVLADDHNSTEATEEIQKQLRDASEKRETAANKARSAQNHFMKTSARAKELEQKVVAMSKDAMQQRVDALETQRDADVAQGQISMQKAREEENRARLEMAVLEGKLQDTVAALAALEVSRKVETPDRETPQLASVQGSDGEATKLLDQDPRWKAIQDQQQSTERVLRAQVEEQKNRSVAEREEFERMLRNKTDAERRVLEEEHNRTNAERQRLAAEKTLLEEQFRMVVTQYRSSEQERLQAERLQNQTEASRRSAEAAKNATESKLNLTTAQKLQIEANKTKVERDLQNRTAELLKTRATLEDEKLRMTKTLEEVNTTLARIQAENKTREVQFMSELAALNRSLTTLRDDEEKLRQNLSSVRANLTRMEGEREEREEEMSDMQETIDALRGFLPPAFIGPRRMVKGFFGALSMMAFNIWRTLVAFLIVGIICIPYVKKLSESSNLMDMVLEDIGVDLHVIAGLGCCFWFGAWGWGFSWIIVTSILSVSHFQSRREKLARNAARIAHPAGLTEKKSVDRAHPKYLIQLWVKSAQFYFAQDNSSVGDPYVVVEFGAQEPKKTETVMNSMKPEWNQMFEFEAEDMSTRIKVNIWDWDRLSSDDFIGSFQFWITDIVRTTQPYAKGKPKPFAFRQVEGATKKGHVVLEWTWCYSFQDQNQQVPWYEKAMTVPRVLGSSRDPGVNLISKDAAEAEAFMRVLRLCAPGVITAVEGLVKALVPYAFPYQNLHVVLAAMLSYVVGSLGLDVGFLLPLAYLVHSAEVCYTASIYRKEWRKLLPLMDHRVRALDLWQKEYIHEQSRVPPEYLWDVFQRIRSDIPHCLAQPDTAWLNGFLRLFWDIYRPWLSAYLHSLITYFAGAFATVEEVFPGKTAPQLMNIVGVNGSYADVPNHRDRLQVCVLDIDGFARGKVVQAAYATISVLNDAGEEVKHETEVSVGHGKLQWTADKCTLMVDPKNQLTEKLVIRVFEGHPDDRDKPPAPASCSASVMILMDKLVEHCPPAEKKWDGTEEAFERTHEVEPSSKLNTLRVTVRYALQRSSQEQTTMEHMGNIYVLDADIVWDTELFVKLSVVGMGITVHIKRLVLPARLVLEWCHPDRDLGKGVPTLDKFGGDFKEFARAFNTQQVFPNLNRLWLALRRPPEIDEKIDLPMSKNLLKAPGIKQLLGDNFLVNIVYSVFPLNIFGGGAYIPTFHSSQLADKLDVSKSEGITRQGKLRLHVLRVSIDEEMTVPMDECNLYCMVRYGKLTEGKDESGFKDKSDVAKKIVDVAMQAEGQYRNTQIRWGTRRPCFSGRFEFDVVKLQAEAVAFSVYLRQDDGCDLQVMEKVIPMVELVDSNALVADSFPHKLRIRADRCKVEVLAYIRTIESSDDNFDMPALEESPEGLEQYELKKRDDGRVQNFDSMLKSAKSLRNHKVGKVDGELYRTFSSVLRQSSGDVGWMGLGGDNNSLHNLPGTVRVVGMPGTLTVCLTKLQHLPPWALPTETSDVELVVSLVEETATGTEVVQTRTETWTRLLSSKALVDVSAGKGEEAFVTKRMVVFAFEVGKACTRHALRLRLKRKGTVRNPQEDLKCKDWGLGRLVSPGDGSFVSNFREPPPSRSLVTDKGIDLALYPSTEIFRRDASDEEEQTPQVHRPTIGLSLSFLPWDAAAEPCVLVTVHKARDLPWFHGFQPPDAFCKMHSEFRLRDRSKPLSSFAHPNDAAVASPSLLPHIDRDARHQEKSSETFERDLHPSFEKKFLFYANRELLDARHFKEQILILQVYQEALDTEGNKQPARTIGYHAVSVRKLYLEHAAMKRQEIKAAAAAPAAAKEKKWAPRKQMWPLREDSEETKQDAPESARGIPYSSAQVSLVFLGDWSHVTEEADEELDDKMLQYNTEQRELLLKAQQEKLEQEAGK